MIAARAVATAIIMLLAQSALAVEYTALPALPQANPAELQLADITACSDRLLAVGERGAIIFSDDDGQQWQQAQSPVSALLTAVHCLPSGRAWAVGHGGVILASEDRGETWVLQFDGNEANQLWLAYAKAKEAALALQVENLGDEAGDLEFALEDATYAIEDAMKAVETGPADPFLDVWVRDDGHGMAVGAYGMLYGTDDYGENWRLMAAGIDNPDRYHYYSLAVSSSGTLYMSGEAGLLYRSDDDGVTWQRLDSGYDGSLFGVLAIGDSSVLSFGLRGNILRSNDSGASWQVQAEPDNPGASLYGGGRVASGEIVLVGAGGTVLRGSPLGMGFSAQQLASRSTLSGVIRAANGQLLVVGMAGVEKAAGDAQ